MEYGSSDSFPFDFERIGIPFGPKSKGKLSPRSYSIQSEKKWNTSFLSVSQRRLVATHGDYFTSLEASQFYSNLHQKVFILLCAERVSDVYLNEYIIKRCNVPKFLSLIK